MNTPHPPHRAGPNEPATNDEAAGVEAGGFREQVNHASLYSAASEPIGKAFSTLQARLALRGYSLIELADDGFLICRWNYSRHLVDLRGVQGFLRQIGGAS